MHESAPATHVCVWSLANSKMTFRSLHSHNHLQRALCNNVLASFSPRFSRRWISLEKVSESPARADAFSLRNRKPLAQPDPTALEGPGAALGLGKHGLFKAGASWTKALALLTICSPFCIGDYHGTWGTFYIAPPLLDSGKECLVVLSQLHLTSTEAKKAVDHGPSHELNPTLLHLFHLQLRRWFAFSRHGRWPWLCPRCVAWGQQQLRQLMAILQENQRQRGSVFAETRACPRIHAAALCIHLRS